MLLPREWAKLKDAGKVTVGFLQEKLTDDDGPRRPAVYAPNINALVDYIATHKPNRGASTTAGETGWYGTNSLDEALNLFKNNRQELLPKGFKQHKIKNLHSLGTDVAFDVTGDFLDVGRYLSGEPEVFGKNINGDLTGKVIRVYINASVSYSWDAEEIMLGAEKLAEVINALYLSGAKVSTTFLSAEETQWVEVKLNDFGDPIDPVDLIAVASPSFIRRLCFAVNNYHEVFQGGTIVDVLAKHKDILNKGEDLTVYIRPNTIVAFDRDGAVDRSLNHIKEAIEWENTKTLVLKP